MELANRARDTAQHIHQLGMKIKLNLFAGKNKDNAPLIEELNYLLSLYKKELVNLQNINIARANYYYFSGDYYKAI